MVDATMTPRERMLIAYQNKLPDRVPVSPEIWDAVALAVRFNCPIFTYENVLKETSMIKEDDKKENSGEKEIAESDSFIASHGLEEYSIEELEKMLKEAIENEDYEKASRYRDEINRRK